MNEPPGICNHDPGHTIQYPSGASVMRSLLHAFVDFEFGVGFEVVPYSGFWVIA